MKIALGVKARLGFIDGTIDPPSQDFTLYVDWRKANYMVLSWLLLNSICKEIDETLVYALFAKDLWLEIKVRYGESNGPLILSDPEEDQ